MEKLDVVETWLDQVAFANSGSEETEIRYRANIAAFCDFIEKEPEEIVEEYDQCKRDRDFKKKYTRYLKSWLSSLMKKGYASGTIDTMLNAVRSFFKYNDLPLSFIPRGSGRVKYANRDITKEEITMIIGASRPRERAFVAIMAQSGLRPSTICKLRLKHLEPDLSSETIPCKIEVPQNLAKGKYKSYFTFIGAEGVKYTEAYLNTRETNKESLLFSQYNEEKEVNPKTFSSIFRTTLSSLQEADKLDFVQEEEGKPSELRLYSLRKWFRKQAFQSGEKFVQFWMGHVLGNQDEHYFSRDIEYHRKQYEEKAMPFLRIEELSPKNKKVESLEKEIEEMREILKRQERTIAILKKAAKLGFLTEEKEE